MSVRVYVHLRVHVGKHPCACVYVPLCVCLPLCAHLCACVGGGYKVKALPTGLPRVQLSISRDIVRGGQIGLGPQEAGTGLGGRGLLGTQVSRGKRLGFLEAEMGGAIQETVSKSTGLGGGQGTGPRGEVCGAGTGVAHLCCGHAAGTAGGSQIPGSRCPSSGSWSLSWATGSEEGGRAG